MEVEKEDQATTESNIEGREWRKIRRNRRSSRRQKKRIMGRIGEKERKIGEMVRRKGKRVH